MVLQTAKAPCSALEGGEAFIICHSGRKFFYMRKYPLFSLIFRTERPLMNAALDAAARSGIVDPLVIERKDGVEGASAMTLRNAIRAFGPTIDYMPASSRTAS